MNKNTLEIIERYREAARAAIKRSNQYWNSQLYYYAGKELEEAKRCEEIAKEIEEGWEVNS